jgi:hypothetical protein
MQLLATSLLSYTFGFALGAYADEIYYALVHYGPGLSLVW